MEDSDRQPPPGVYMHGGVGTGKTFMMDLFYEVRELRQSTRQKVSQGLSLFLLHDCGLWIMTLCHVVHEKYSLLYLEVIVTEIVVRTLWVFVCD